MSGGPFNWVEFFAGVWRRWETIALNNAPNLNGLNVFWRNNAMDMLGQRGVHGFNEPGSVYLGDVWTPFMLMHPTLPAPTTGGSAKGGLEELG